MLDPIAELKKVVSAEGSESKAAKKLELTRQYINDLLKGKRQPGPTLLKNLGLEIRYVRARR